MAGAAVGGKIKYKGYGRKQDLRRLRAIPSYLFRR